MFAHIVTRSAVAVLQGIVTVAIASGPMDRGKLGGGAWRASVSGSAPSLEVLALWTVGTLAPSPCRRSRPSEPVTASLASLECTEVLTFIADSSSSRASWPSASWRL